MAQGIPKSEQYALIGLIVLIAGGLTFQTLRSNDRGEEIWVEGGSSWQPLASETAEASPPAASAPRVVNPLALMPDAGQETPEVAPAPASPVSISPAAVAPASEAAIDINTASAEELARLPGIGPSKAEAIIAHRQTFGGFRSADDLLNVRGIGAKTLETLRPYIAVSGSPAVFNAPSEAPTAAPASAGPIVEPAAVPADSPPVTAAVAETRTPRAPAAQPGKININTASSQELEQIPGIGPVLAGRIIEYRRHRRFARPEDLILIRGIGEKTFEKMRPFVVVN